MQIKTTNPDMFFCLLYEGFAIAVIDHDPEIEGYNHFDVKGLDYEALSKYKDFDYIEVFDKLPDNLVYKTMRDYSPRWLTGMVAKSCYEKHFF
jgi:hypothetical protein